MAREAPALAACRTHLDRLGAGFLGIKGDPNHSYGYHIAVEDLKRPDYSSQGPGDTTGPKDTACAIDVRVTPIADLYGKKVAGWPTASKFLEWVRVERAADRLPEVAELIGARRSWKTAGWKVAWYAADSTGWKWTRYKGSGHTDWFHLAIYRKYANVSTFADRTFGLWGPAGLEKKESGVAGISLSAIKQWNSAYSFLVNFSKRKTEYQVETDQRLAELSAELDALKAKVGA